MSLRLSKFDYILAALVFLVVTVFQIALSFHWYDLKLFDQYNVIFDSDPNTWLRYGSSTHPDAGTTKHPLAAYYTGIPVIILSEGISAFRGVESTAGLRTGLALCAIPIACGLKSALVYTVLRQLKLSTADALLIVGISAASFSSIVFGALPETYGYTGLFTAVAVWLVVRNHDKGGPKNLWAFVFNAVLLIGTSAANAITVFWMFFMRTTLDRLNIARAFVYSASITVGCYIVTQLAFWSSANIRGLSLSFGDLFSSSTSDIQKHSPDLLLQVLNLLRFPERLSRSVFATAPDKKENILLIDGDVYDFEFTYNTIEFNLFSALLLGFGLCLLIGAALSIRQMNEVWRKVVVFALGSTILYAGLFSFYGYNTFLYSQHWQITTVLVLASFLHTFSRQIVFVRAALGAILILCVISSAITLAGMNSELLAHCGSACT